MLASQSDCAMEKLREWDGAWSQALDELRPAMHAVDRDACLIWFQFFPLELLDFLAGLKAGDKPEQHFQFRGHYLLTEIANTSHRFLYGHRFWPAVKKALWNFRAEASLVASIEALATQVDVARDLSLAICAIGLMTLRQAGWAFLDQSYTPAADERTPEDVLRSRATDTRTGWLRKRQARVIIDERQEQGWFPLIPGQHITTAAALDKRPYEATNTRCSPGNGPIPVDCRAGSCGTCWVGILGGGENLQPVDDFERKRMAYFGYWDTRFHQDAETRPLIRLACQCVAAGSCAITIPPWNGVWGRPRRLAYQRWHNQS